ncbi:MULTISPECIES: PucR family transcriptional regulator [Mumia]|uniref:PucR family transcriptional regulator n=1 Tax=Mumia TaxID=1546255 RepID=UPI001423ABD5|nr:MULTISPECIES: helix-turn-helix domain-containing protein [unclassified Mumia]QMW66634.1 helix-turn-helix domain-containing protein [Mumia sp. ZJ1417]
MDPRDDDLTSLANSLAELVGAPITIEDPDSSVLAYSQSADAERSQAVDDARITTILGRQVPPHYRALLDDAGVFTEIARSREVVTVDLSGSGMTRRAIVAVRDDSGTLLGSVWAAVPDGITSEQRQAMLDLAPVVAGRLVRLRERADSTRQRTVEVVETLLSGGDDAVRAAQTQGLRTPCTVLVLAADRARLAVPAARASAFVLHLAAVAPSAAAAQVDDVVYAVVAGPEATAARVARDFLARSRGPLVAGVGRTVDSAAAIDLSARDADAVVRVLRRRGRSGVVETVRGALADVVALRSADAWAGYEEFSPLTALVRFDDEHHAELLSTARAYLAHGGDVAAAAASLHVHPNTLRNRLRRASQAVGVDLDDPDTRLLLALHLKVTDVADAD